MKIKNTKYLLFVSSALLIVFLVSGCQKKIETVQISGDSVSATTALITESSTPTTSVEKVSTSKPVVKATSTVKKIEIPGQLVLPVAFAQQAPFGNWDALHEEACEEASMIMAYKYFDHATLNETIMESEIQNVISWENNNGYLVDLTAQEMVDILNSHYGLSAKLSTEVTTDRIKYELSQGNLIIVPAAGRELGNPNFKAPGPIYHVLVIKGYNDSQFITNDPGTRKGNSFTYSYSKLINAVHDWNPQLADGGMTDAEMDLGRKVMIVVAK